MILGSWLREWSFVFISEELSLLDKGVMQVIKILKVRAYLHLS